MTGRLDLATKTDLRDLEPRLTIRVGGMLVIAVGVPLGGLAATTSIVLNRLPTATPTGPHASASAGIVLAADTSGALSPEPYSCRLFVDEQKKCAFGSCDPRTIERLKRECLRDDGRP